MRYLYDNYHLIKNTIERMTRIASIVKNWKPQEGKGNITAIQLVKGSDKNCFAQNTEGVTALSLMPDYTLPMLELGDDAKALTYLYLSENKSLKKLVFEKALPKLTHIYIDGCDLEEIVFPAGFDALEQIYVQKQENKLKRLVFQGDCPKLQLLDASGNGLTAFVLPNGFKQLEYLYLHDNQLTKLNFGGDLPQLAALNVQNNQLKDLPTEGVSYSKLERLNVKGNPLKYEERLINGDASGNADEIIGLLRASFKSGETVNYRAKLIIVGNGRIGKTCLVNRLIGEPCRDDQTFTHGISIVHLDKRHLPNVKTEELDLRIWDFGGQEVYYATHQFFLSEEAAYLYAWTDKTIAEENKEKDKIKSPTLLDDKWRNHDYWLDNIRLHSQGSPILVIRTHCIKAREVFPFERLNDTYTLKTHPIDFDAKSLETSYLVNLEKQLTDIVNNLPLLGSAIPNNYNDVITALEKEKQAGKSELSKIAFADIAQTAKIDDKDIERLLSYLKLTGDIIYFPDNEKLKERIFINPQKLIQQVYKLIENNNALVKNEGVFDSDYAKQVLGWANWEVLIALLNSFQLIYQKPSIQNKKNEFIAPQYLPRLEDKGRNDKSSFEGHKAEKTLRFRLHYPRFMPENVMINVLSQYGPYSIDSVYRNAIYFIKEHSKEGCVIECNEAEKEVKVYTNLNDEADTVAKEVFEKFIELSHKAEVTITVKESEPVNCSVLKKALEQNKDIPTVNGGWINDKRIFDFLFKGHLDDRIKEKTIQKTETKDSMLDAQNKVRNHIANDKTKEAIALIESWANQNNAKRLLNDIAVIKADWLKLKREENIGTAEDANKRNNRINKQILDLDWTDDDPSPLAEPIITNPQPKTALTDMKGVNKNLIIGGVIAIIILLLPIWKTKSGSVSLFNKLIDITIGKTETPEKDVPKVVDKKVFIKGKLRLNNTQVATINDVASVSIKDNGANSETLDSEGSFTFKNVTLLPTNEILVEVTFPDNSILPTKTISLDAPNDKGIIQLPTLSINKIDKPKHSSSSQMKDRFTINIINGDGSKIDNSHK